MVEKTIRPTLLFICACLLAGPMEAGAACSAPINKIEAENCLPGSPKSEWDLTPVGGDASIQGFAADISYNIGETAQFKINTSAPAFQLDIYRLGYYGGLGARKVATVLPTGTGVQPPCVNDAATGLIDCGNWSVTAEWAISTSAVTGVYLAKIIRADTGGASHIIFIVRNDEGTEGLLLTTSDSTWQAYNPWGGNSLYIGQPSGTGAYKVSYNRPFAVRGAYPTSLFNQEYPVIRFLEANGYDVAYFTSVDADRRGHLIRNHPVYLSVGHDEYWSAGHRSSVEAARAAGVNLIFFSSVASLWKTRWEPSIAGPQTSFRTLVCYKETTRGKIDPQDPPTWTGMWRDKKLSPTSDGGRWENELTGNSYSVDALRNDAITVQADAAGLRFWRNTAVAGLTGSQSITFPQTLGFEWDEDTDNSSRPPGLVRLSSSTYVVAKHLVNTLYEAGPVTHHMVFYKHPSGSKVFSAGTMQWGWGLDNVHDGGSGLPPQPAMRQATINLLADMGAQPASLLPGLVPASPSQDSVPPVSYVTFPTSSTVVTAGVPIVISGTAADFGGGVVGAVDVSTDNGGSWHPAVGREAWSYAWTPTFTGTTQVISRASDDSGNLGTPGAPPPPPPPPPDPPPPPPPNPGPAGSPALTALDPQSILVGAPGFVLTVQGSGFASDASIMWRGAMKPTLFLSSTALQAAIEPADVSEAGVVSVLVVNPGPGGGVSPPMNFTVEPEAVQTGPAERVFPNPWRADRHNGRPVVFDQLGPGSEVRIFTASGRWIRTLSAPAGSVSWELTDETGGSVASGFYIYRITGGRSARGKLLLIK